MRREREMWATGPTTCQPLAALRRIFFFYLRKPGTDRPSVFPVLPPMRRHVCDECSLAGLGSSSAQVKNPTSRKEREKWGTPALADTLPTLSQGSIEFSYSIYGNREVMYGTDAHWLAWAHRQLKSKTPLLAKNARNGAPSTQPVEGCVPNGR